MFSKFFRNFIDFKISYLELIELYSEYYINYNFVLFLKNLSLHCFFELVTEIFIKYTISSHFSNNHFIF